MNVHFLGDAIIGATDDLEKMVTFMAFYGRTNNTKYTVEGSIIGCTCLKRPELA